MIKRIFSILILLLILSGCKNSYNPNIAITKKVHNDFIKNGYYLEEDTYIKNNYNSVYHFHLNNNENYFRFRQTYYRWNENTITTDNCLYFIAIDVYVNDEGEETCEQADIDDIKEIKEIYINELQEIGISQGDLPQNINKEE